MMGRGHPSPSMGMETSRIGTSLTISAVIPLAIFGQPSQLCRGGRGIWGILWRQRQRWRCSEGSWREGARHLRPSASGTYTVCQIVPAGIEHVRGERLIPDVRWGHRRGQFVYAHRCPPASSIVGCWAGEDPSIAPPPWSLVDDEFESDARLSNDAKRRNASHSLCEMMVCRVYIIVLLRRTTAWIRRILWRLR
jgi:hypothetical protein